MLAIMNSINYSCRSFIPILEQINNILTICLPCFYRKSLRNVSLSTSKQGYTNERSTRSSSTFSSVGEQSTGLRCTSSIHQITQNTFSEYRILVYLKGTQKNAEHGIQINWLKSGGRRSCSTFLVLQEQKSALGVHFLYLKKEKTALGVQFF